MTTSTLCWTFLITSINAISGAIATSANQPNLVRRQIGYIGTTSFINRNYHAALALGGYLYVDGGDISYNNEGVFEHVPDNNTYAIDLSTDWTNETVNLNAIPKTAPVLCFSHLWPDRTNGIMYAFGGEQCHSLTIAESPPVPPTSLWKFTPNGASGTWTQVEDIKGLSDITRPAGASSAFGKEQAYLLGGFSSSRSSSETNDVVGSQPLPGLLTYNYATNTFTNSSALEFNTHGTSEFGEMHLVPASAVTTHSTDGLLAAFGGDFSTASLWVDSGAKLRAFGKIHLYNPGSKTWYNQTATGSIPEVRDRFCSVGVQGDNGTYEIFMFGGHVASASGDAEASANVADQARNLLRDEVFVLTIPGFHWLKADYSPSWPRIGHTCNVIGNRQMVVVGGLNPSAMTKSELLSQKDPWANGIGIFDMSEMGWKDSYDSSAEKYTSPAVVKNWYSNNGGLYPKAWDESGLREYFTGTESATAPGSPSSASPVPASSSSAASKSGSGASTGAIVGGVVGGLAGGLLIAAALWFFLIRRRRQDRRERGQAEDAYSLHSRDDRQLVPVVPAEVKKPSPAGRAELAEKRASRPVELAGQDSQRLGARSPWSSDTETLKSPVSPIVEMPTRFGRAELAA